MENGDNGGGYVRVWSENIWELSVPSTKFCCKSKIAPTITSKHTHTHTHTKTKSKSFEIESSLKKEK